MFKRLQAWWLRPRSPECVDPTSDDAVREVSELRWRMRRVLGMHGVTLPLNATAADFETSMCEVIEARGDDGYRERKHREILTLVPA